MRADGTRTLEYYECMKKRYFAFDFDGVITHFNTDALLVQSHSPGKPNIETINAMTVLKEQGHVIIIFSTRSNQTLKEYCTKYKVPYDYLNENPEVEFEEGNKGKPAAHVYIDDKALYFQGQTSEELVKQLNNFKQYRG